MGNSLTCVTFKQLNIQTWVTFKYLPILLFAHYKNAHPPAFQVCEAHFKIYHPTEFVQSNIGLFQHSTIVWIVFGQCIDIDIGIGSH